MMSGLKKEGAAREASLHSWKWSHVRLFISLKGSFIFLVTQYKHTRVVSKPLGCL
jgi:hypothetical protein